MAFGATITVGAGTGLFLALLYPLMRPRLLKLDPQRRANVLLGWSLSPTVMGLFFTSLLFVPSLLNRFGIPAGHCHNHAERWPHICLTNPPLEVIEGLPWGFELVLLGILTAILLSQAAHLRRRTLLKRILRGAIPQNGGVFYLLPWNKPAAFTAGFFSPQIYISESLIASVTPEHLKIVLAHEKGHVRRCDSLRQYLGQIFSLIYLPKTRRSILADLNLATEQACDERAAHTTGDHLQVAEAIIAVERLLQKSSSGFAAGAPCFVKNNSAERVHSLLAEGQFEKPLFPAWILPMPLLLNAVLLMPGAVHSLIEYLTSQ